LKKLVLKKSTLAPSQRTYRIPYAGVLNPAQLQAVMHADGPALVLAGAGTGKTRTLTYRVVRLVEDGIDPTTILLLTFTRKAASEMLRRAGALLDGRCEKVSGGTFHAFGYQLLQRFGKGLGEMLPTASISILDQADAEDAMNLVRGRFDIPKARKRFPRASTLVGMTSRAVNTMTPLEDVLAQDYSGYLEDADLLGEVVRAYHAYKRANGLVDYDDLLLLTLSMTRHAELGPVLRKQYQHIMVDEYQDTNALQHGIIMGLAGTRGNVMAVGDDAQSIYAFRGADVRNIHAFPDSFDLCEVIRLEHNYRSTQPILDVCNAILRDAPNMFRKELFSERKEGELPMLVACSNDRQQSEFIVQQILDYREQGLDLNSMAVLFRSGFLSFDLEIALDKANIPFRKIGGLRFTESAHVKDLLALLRITENPRDALAWYRSLLLLPGVGTRTAQAFLDEALTQPDPLVSPLPTLNGKGATSIRELVELLKGARAVADAEERAQLLATWYKPTMEQKYDDAGKRWKDVETIVGICSRYRTTAQFLADVALEPPQDTLADSGADDGEDDILTLSTIHSAKGLEWNTVFVMSVNEGHLPSARSAEKEGALEEERRLLYVACTRAKERLILTYPTIVAEREFTDVLGRASRFLDGVGEELCPQYALEAEEMEDEKGDIPGAQFIE
jgi:DNA helicase-2/ATP-dependent DNA helicase PcrA